MRLLLWFVLSISVVLTGVPTMAEEPAPTAEALQKQIDAINKQAELLDAQKKLVDGQKALLEAQKPTADEIAAAKTAKELADAQKAQSDASLAAFKAALGEVPSSGISGTVDAQGSAGALEATLLAMKALREAASQLADRVGVAVKDGPHSIAVVSASEAPTFANLVAYDTEVAVVSQLLTTAIAAAKPPAPGAKPEAATLPLLGAAGVSLEAASKLLSLFRSDYVVKDATVTLADKDVMALHAVAGALAGLKGADDKPLLEVSVPTLYDPVTPASAAGFFIDDVTALAALRGEAQELHGKVATEVAAFKKAIEAEQNPAAKAALEAEMAKKAKLATGLQSAMALMDAWYTKLGTGDSKGVAALVSVAREKTLAAAIKTSHLLILKLQATGGGVMTKKNLWTFFGGMPLYHMGGAGLSFTLVRGDSGLVKASGVVPIHGGFVKAGNVRQELEN